MRWPCDPPHDPPRCGCVPLGSTIAAMPRGRPPQDGRTRDRSIRVLCHSEQEAAWRAAAELAGEDLSTWVRETLDSAALEQAKRAGRTSG
jgi:hypothetical protein